MPPRPQGPQCRPQFHQHMPRDQCQMMPPLNRPPFGGQRQLFSPDPPPFWSSRFHPQPPFERYMSHFDQRSPSFTRIRPPYAGQSGPPHHQHWPQRCIDYGQGVQFPSAVQQRHPAQHRQLNATVQLSQSPQCDEPRLTCSQTERSQAAGLSHTKQATNTSVCRDQFQRQASTSSFQLSLDPANQPMTGCMWTPGSQPDVKLESVSECDSREDFAQQHVLNCIQALGEANGEVMFVISQLNFAGYMNRPCYAAAAETLPCPKNLPSTKHRRGDFDLLLIHRYNGVLVGEIKAIGLNSVVDPKVLADRIQKAIHQLDKSEVVVKHLVSDVARGLAVRKALILPYVSKAELRQVVNFSSALQKTFCKCLGGQDLETALGLCLCSDHLNDRTNPRDVSDQVLVKLKRWWQRQMAKSDKHWSPSAYLDVVARFVGPATTVSVHCVVPPRVEVRTRGDAVSELGNRLALLVLTPQQVRLIHANKAKVCLTGPPGTGKTVVLLLKALHWLRQGHDVHIVSARITSRAVSCQMRHQLSMSVDQQQAEELKRNSEKTNFGKIQLCFYDVYEREEDIEECVSEMKEAAKDRLVHIISDEIHPSHRVAGPRFHKLFKRLCADIPSVHLWVASLTKENIPSFLDQEMLTVPLRSAPAILREVSPGVDTHPVHSYTTDSACYPYDGLDVIRVKHQGPNHTGTWPVGCRQCGHEVAAELKRLRVGVEDPGNSSGINSPAPLQYRDVFVLTRTYELKDGSTDAEGNDIPACGFIAELRTNNIPVQVINKQELTVEEWKRRLEETSKSRHDEVVASVWGSVCGLERKVVVYLPGRTPFDSSKTKQEIDDQDRLYAISRCTTQLIIVDCDVRD